MSQQKKIVFLYTEMAGYFISCVRALSKANGGGVWVYHWPVNKEAPFQFSDVEGVVFKDRTGIADDQLVKELSTINPDVIVTSGWMDKGYGNALKKMRQVGIRIVSLDNHWRGDTRQRLAAMASPFTLKKRYTHAWVPGKPQKEFAGKLGFENVLEGFYCADVERFHKYYQAFGAEKAASPPKRFLYVGRYVEHKGIFEMWKAFIQAIGDRTDWELWCLGTGDQYDQRVEHPQIKHFGFVQPGDMDHYVQNTSVFILPSKFEPWGVVVQEYAASGFPLLLSDQVGAGERFLKDGVNGFRFRAGDVEEMVNAFQKVMELSDEALAGLASESVKLGLSHTPEIWAKTILEVS